MAEAESRAASLAKLNIGAGAPSMVRHDYKRAVYRAFLSEFPPETIRKYFDRHPLVIEGREYRGHALYELLWKKKVLVPSAWEVVTDNHLEDFLLSEGKDPKDIMSKILWVSGGSAPIPGKLILSWLYPKLEALHNRLDTRDICFGLITLVTENWIPGRIHRRVRRRERGEWIENVLIFIDDMRYRHYLDWDYEFIAGPMIVEAPAKLGLPPFERFGMLADTRPPERIVREPEDAPSLDGGILRIRGELFGTVRAFSAFWRGNHLDLSKYNPPDVEVIVVEKDYFCPRRKRVVLHAGCAYGAPFFLCWTEHRKLASRKGGMLTALISDIDREEIEEETDLLESRHRALLESLEESALFTYHAEDESLSLNGRHFVKGIPAKIMRSLLLAYLQDGKTEFEYRDFKRDFDISLGQKNANFEVRLYRLMERLAEQKTCVLLKKTSRGRFVIQVSGAVAFSETPQPEAKV